MKKTIVLIGLSMLTFTVIAQKKVQFKVGMEPETTYKQTSKQIMKSTVYIDMPKEESNSLRELNMDNPQITTEETNSLTSSQTGVADENGVFKVQTKYDEVIVDGVQNRDLDGVIIYGSASTEQMPVYDSIHAPNMDESLKAMVLSTVSNILSQVQFPDKSLKVGDSFQKKDPISLPIGQVTLDMDIISKYKLISIKDGIAELTLDQDLKMKTNIEGYDMNAEGEGEGVILYDIAKHYIISYETDMVMEMKMKIEGMKMKLIQESKISEKVEIGG